MIMTVEHDQTERDLWAAYMLLVGDTVRDEKGRLTKLYLNGDAEIEARRALARLLRNGKPLDSLLRHMLACLFDSRPTGDPVVDTLLDTNPIERQLVFKRDRGSGEQAMRHREIAEKVFAERYKHPDKSVTDIEGEVANDLEISEETVKAATHRFRNRFKPARGLG
jgi:hypothetical protein